MCQCCSLILVSWNAVDASCFQAKVILDGLKETGNLPTVEVGSFYVGSC